MMDFLDLASWALVILGVAGWIKWFHIRQDSKRDRRR